MRHIRVRSKSLLIDGHIHASGDVVALADHDRADRFVLLGHADHVAAEGLGQVDQLTKIREAVRALLKAPIYEERGRPASGISVAFLAGLTNLGHAAGMLEASEPVVAEAIGLVRSGYLDALGAESPVPWVPENYQAESSGSSPAPAAAVEDLGQVDQLGQAPSPAPAAAVEDLPKPAGEGGSDFAMGPGA